MLNNRITRKGLKFIFLYYLIWIVFVVIFKMSFSYSELIINREINLIPFYYENESHIHLIINEMISNIIVFIPFGILVRSIFYSDVLKRNILFSSLIPLIIECIQYGLSIGIFDITDIINNNLGIVFGVVIYQIFLKISKNKNKLDKYLFVTGSVLAFILTIILTLFVYTNS